MDTSIQHHVSLTANLKVDIQVHNVHDQSQLIEVDLIFEQSVRVARHLHLELVIDIFCYLWVF